VNGAGTDRRALVVGLDFPTGLTTDADGTIFITETAGGRVLGLTESGAVTTVATGLGQPEGIAIAPDGRLLVIDVAAKSLVAIEPDAGTQTVLANGLPVGLANGPSLFRDVAAFGDRVFFNSDVDNTIYEIRY